MWGKWGGKDSFGDDIGGFCGPVGGFGGATFGMAHDCLNQDYRD